MKICYECKKEKDESEFSKHKNRKDGLQTICKKCKQQYSKTYSVENKKELSEYNKRHYERYKREKEIKRRTYRRGNPARILLYSSRRRAFNKGIEWNLKFEDISIPSHCPILGIPLKMNFAERGDDSYSMDRIDNSKGYTRDNIQIISWRANKIKNDATLHELKAIVKFMESLASNKANE